MFGVRKSPTGCNFVHNDEIWYFMIFMYYKARSVLIRCVVSLIRTCAGKITFAANCRCPESGPIRGDSLLSTTV